MIVLIDEYDNPLMTSYEMNYYDDAITFYQSWMTSALKSNKNLYLSVISGLLRIGQESFFSKLNYLTFVEK